MLGFDVLGTLALGEIKADGGPPVQPVTPKPDAWQVPEKTLARKIVRRAFVACLAGAILPPLGLPEPPAPCSWDPANKDSGITLALDNTKATNVVGPSPNFRNVKTTNSKSGNGTYVFKLIDKSGGNGESSIGLANASAPLNGDWTTGAAGSTPDSCAVYLEGGDVYYNASSIGVFSGTPLLTDRYWAAVLSTGTVLWKYSTDGTTWVDAPATVTRPTGDLFLMFGTQLNGDTVTADLSPTGWTLSGAQNWCAGAATVYPLAPGWPEQRPRKTRIHASQQQFLAYVPDVAAAPEDVTEDKWHQPWSIPARLSRQGPTQQGFEFVYEVPAAEDVTEDKWHQAWSEPKRFHLALRTANHPSLGFVYSEPVVVDVPEDRWHQPWSEPKRFHLALRTASQPVLAFVYNEPVIVDVPEDRWHQPWSMPKRFKLGLRAGNQPVTTYYETPVTEVIEEDKWHQPWSIPKRFKRGLRAGNQAFTTYFETPITETIHEDKWHQPWSTPKRFKRGLRTGNHPFTTYFFTPVVAPITVGNWFAPLSLPVREVIGFKAWLQQTVAWQPRPFPTTITAILDATETNADRAEIVYVVRRAVVSAKVSIVEGPPAAVEVSVAEGPQPGVVSSIRESS